MVKKYFTDQSLRTLISKIKEYVESAISGVTQQVSSKSSVQIITWEADD